MRDHKELYWHWLKFLKDNDDKVVLKVKHDEFLYPLRRDPFLLGDELCLWVSSLDYPLRVELILEVLVIDDDTSVDIKVFNNYLAARLWRNVSAEGDQVWVIRRSVDGTAYDMVPADALSSAQTKMLDELAESEMQELLRFCAHSYAEAMGFYTAFLWGSRYNPFDPDDPVEAADIERGYERGMAEREAQVWTPE